MHTAIKTQEGKRRLSLVVTTQVPLISSFDLPYFHPVETLLIDSTQNFHSRTMHIFCLRTAKHSALYNNVCTCSKE